MMGKRDEEQIRTTQTQHMELQTHKQRKKDSNRGKVLERPVETIAGGRRGEGGRLQ